MSLTHPQWLSRKIETDRLRMNFKVLASKRKYFPGVEWIEFEKLGMLAVCNERIALVEGRGGMRTNPLTLEEVEEAESQASGHSDYAKKFILRLVEKMFNDCD